jgi:hypothetical protein
LISELRITFLSVNSPLIDSSILSLFAIFSREFSNSLTLSELYYESSPYFLNAGLDVKLIPSILSLILCPTTSVWAYSISLICCLKVSKVPFCYLYLAIYLDPLHKTYPAINKNMATPKHTYNTVSLF